MRELVTLLGVFTLVSVIVIRPRLLIFIYLFFLLNA
jgi:hypothetical protein